MIFDIEWDLLGSIKHVVQDNAPASLWYVWRYNGWAYWGVDDLLITSVGGGWGVISASKLAHEGVARVVVEVHASNISIVEGTSTTCSFLVITTTSTIKIAGTTCIGTAATRTRKGGALELLRLTGKTLEQILSRLVREFVVAKANADGTTSEIEAVHFLQRFFGGVGVTEPGVLMLINDILRQEGNGEITYWTKP
jgi:hypothetical protein